MPRLMHFFTEQDIMLLHQYAGQIHSGTGEAKQVEVALAQGVWKLTQEWAARLAGEKWMAKCRRSVVKQAGSTPRQADGRRRMRRTFRPYTWARLYQEADESRKIFFTVGVDGKTQELVWKLDCQRKGAQALDQRLVERFDEYMRRHAPEARWRSIQLEHLPTWNWNRLLAECRAFMAANLVHYEAAQAYTWQLHDPERNKLARVCWNSLGWQRPSGPVGKSVSTGSHENSAFAGFGGEEWLFNFERLIDGFHYAFLQPLNTGPDRNTYQGRVFNIRLFTRNEATGRYYYVGRIREAHVLTEVEMRHAEQEYRRRKWLQVMQQDLREVGACGSVTMDGYAPGPFNLRFRPGDVERPDTPDGLEPIQDIDTWTKSKRYKLFRDLGPPVDGARKSMPHPNEQRSVVLNDARSGKQGLKVRQTQGAVIELAGLHDQLQERLVSWLKAHFPAEQVSREAYIRVDGTRLDVVRELASGHQVFYEVKVLPSLRSCIREALGQLMEYAHWAGSDLSREWVIVSYHGLTDDAAAYLQKVASLYGLPVSYQQIALAE